MNWTWEQLNRSMLSDRGYRITCLPMARGYWYNAYTPGGILLASGNLERCASACDAHNDFEAERNGKRPISVARSKRPRRVAMAVAG